MKVGDYVRTNLKNEIVICKVIDIIHSTSMNDNRMVFDKPTKFTYYVEDNKNYKSSPNIIDLIEVGDYVNGYLVKDIDYAFDDVVMNNKNARIVPYIDCNKDKYIDDIKSIVTKEQFESMEYRIGE